MIKYIFFKTHIVIVLFLVTDRVNIEFVSPDLAVAQIKMLQQTFEMYEGLKDEGKLKFAYAFADSPGGITLWDVESNDELQKILFLLPSMPLVTRTVTPLTEMKAVSQVIEELRSIVNSMPKKPSQQSS
jgi:muconolactone D-isomerase